MLNKILLCIKGCPNNILINSMFIQKWPKNRRKLWGGSVDHTNEATVRILIFLDKAQVVYLKEIVCQTLIR